MTNFHINFASIRKLILLVSVISHGVFLQPASAIEPQISSITFGLTAGTIYGVDVNDARAAQETWTHLVMQKVNQTERDIKVKSVIYPDISAANDAIKENKVDILILLSLEYLSLIDKNPLIPFLTPRAGIQGEELVIVTHKQNNIHSIEQLQSLSLSISTKGNDGIPQLWLETLLLEKALPPSETFFKSIKYVDKAIQAILPVFFKQTDVCLVPKTDLEIAKELNPQLSTNLQIIQLSPAYNRTIVCIREAYYQEYGDRISEAVEITKQTKEGQHLFKIFRISNIIRFEEAHLDNVKNLVQTYHTLSHTSTLPQIKHNTDEK
jgi:ABC-type phosphate/phosphonate transport system substrate-binding protein